jgi:ABC-type multidrug transport system fused ATPase/permease subunit
MKEIIYLIKKFFKENKTITISTVFFEVLLAVLETIFIPFILSDIINSIDIKQVKKDLIKLFLIWILFKIVAILTIHFQTILRPLFTNFIYVNLTKSVLYNSQYENKNINLSLFIDKIHSLKSNLEDFFIMLYTLYIPKFLVVVINTINFFVINYIFGLSFFICFIVLMILLVHDINKQIQLLLTTNKGKDNLYEHIEEVFLNKNIILSTTNGYDTELKNIKDVTDNYKDVEEKSLKSLKDKYNNIYITSIFLLGILLLILFFLYKYNLIDKNKFTKLLLSVVILFQDIYYALKNSKDFIIKLAVLISSDDFLKDIQHVNNEKEDMPQIKDHDISFKNVSYNHEGENKKLLNNLSLNIPSKNIISIYGSSGIGKTTFLNLLFGVLTPISGEIYMNNYDINKYDKKSFRKHMIYIDQNANYLFDITIFENIIYGNKYDNYDKIKEQVKEIFTVFNFYEIFQKLDEGKEKWSFLDFNVGKLGGKLSGGQKKLIHLIRVNFNPQANIILLDEPSNGLDEKNVYNIMEYLLYLKAKNNTILLITHDRKFEKISDKILLFSENRNPYFIEHTTDIGL